MRKGPRPVTNPERELRILRYLRISAGRNAKLASIGGASLVFGVAGLLEVGDRVGVGAALFAVCWLLALVMLVLDDFLP